MAYVVNELSSTVAVFSIDRELLSEIAQTAKRGLPMDKFKGRSTLKLIQSIKTVPSAFPTTMNTVSSPFFSLILVHQLYVQELTRISSLYSVDASVSTNQNDL